ncbi:hypothetical protein [Mesorhizobium sp. IMUNJ 23232]|uniref:hypothetical protein n=1 Tax=Mesorhizobium sp. IMUNJ 23232 TaxID=3376064 RepID=UPI00378B5CA7
MTRLHAVSPDQVIEDYRLGFAGIVSVDSWVHYLSGVRAAQNPNFTMTPVQKRNIGYRFQALEFYAGLLLHNREVQVANPGRSTLHGGLSPILIHQFCTTAHSILEGIGSYLVRADYMARNGVAFPRDTVGTPQWRKQVRIEALQGANPPAISKAELAARLERITNLRDKVHLDRFDVGQHLHYHEFEYNPAFIETYRTFQSVLLSLNPDLPQCCLDEPL